MPKRTQFCFVGRDTPHTKSTDGVGQHRMLLLLLGCSGNHDGHMSIPTKLDHCVIHVSDWDRSNAFYTTVLGAELVARPTGYAYRFGDKQLNVHGPGVRPGRCRPHPRGTGNSDLCFEWVGPIADAIAHLKRCDVAA